MQDKTALALDVFTENYATIYRRLDDIYIPVERREYFEKMLSDLQNIVSLMSERDEFGFITAVNTYLSSIIYNFEDMLFEENQKLIDRMKNMRELELLDNFGKHPQ